MQTELDTLTGGDYQQKLDELATAEQQANQDLAQHADELQQMETAASSLQGEVDLLSRQTKVYSANRDVARANYDLGVRDDVPEARLKFLKGEFDRWQQTVDESSFLLQRKQGELNTARGEIATRTSLRDTVLENRKKLQSDTERIRKALAQIDPPKGTLASFKRKLMMKPIVDGFNSPHGIKQDWLPELKQTLGMAHVARFDRCRTCHASIDDFAPGNLPNFPHGTREEGKYPHPYSSHPNPDVYLAASGPHPLARFGCTVCHDGDGSGTSFQAAEHTPNDPGQAHRWEEEHHWHANHFWEYPMQPSRLLESTCVKCHHSMIELGINPQFGATAPKVFEGYQIVKTYGCFGCHEINGYDGAISIGPDVRLEPTFMAAATQVLQDPAIKDLDVVAAGNLPGLVAKTTEAVTQLSAPLSTTKTAEEQTQEVLSRLQAIDEASRSMLSRLPGIADDVQANPEADEARHALLSLLTSAGSLRDLQKHLLNRLSSEQRSQVATTPQLAARTTAIVEALKDADNPGQMRKVGPSCATSPARQPPSLWRTGRKTRPASALIRGCQSSST